MPWDRGDEVDGKRAQHKREELFKGEPIADPNGNVGPVDRWIHNFRAEGEHEELIAMDGLNAIYVRDENNIEVVNYRKEPWHFYDGDHSPPEARGHRSPSDKPTDPARGGGGPPGVLPRGSHHVRNSTGKETPVEYAARKVAQAQKKAEYEARLAERERKKKEWEARQAGRARKQQEWEERERKRIAERERKRREYEARQGDRDRKQQEWAERQRERERKQREYEARLAERERKKKEWEARQAERARKQQEWEARQVERARMKAEWEARQQERAQRQADYEARQAAREARRSGQQVRGMYGAFFDNPRRGGR